MLLQSRVDGVLLSRVQIQSFGEVGFGIRSTGSAESAALSEDESSGGDRE